MRTLLASASLAAALLVAGCDTDTLMPAGRSVAPLSPAILSEIDKRNMSKESPILVRLFKEESELEVWKETQDGTYALLKTYPICRWSGELGPKVKTGDRQAPEGFYAIRPGLMNPNSQYYLAINTGFPNAYDKANERTGNFLMIHGDCSSAGCYAMTDEQISEIYALARESFFGGQRAFQIQAFPFKMTALNMARHRNSPHMPFWRMIKQGYDHFEVSRLEPKVNVCEKRYVFDAESKGRFDPTAKCPAFTVNEDLVAAVKEKQQQDDWQFAELVRRGTPTVPARIGKDGGMHDVFLATMKSASGDSAAGFRAPWAAPPPGTIPSHATAPGDPRNPAVTIAGVPAVGTTYVRSPPPGPATLVVRVPEPPPASSVLRTAEPAPSGLRAPEPAPSVVRAAEAPTGSIGGDPFRSGRVGSQSAAAQPTSSSFNSFFGNFFSGETAPDPSTRGIESADSNSTPAVRLPPPRPTAAPQTAAKPMPAASSANAAAIRPAAKPDAAANAKADKPEPRSRAADSGVLSGAQAPLPANGFENRFGAWR